MEDFAQIVANLKTNGMEGYKSELYVPMGCFATTVTNQVVTPDNSRRYLKQDLQRMLGNKYKDFEQACRADSGRNLFPVGQSKHTIATGFDIGQKSGIEIENLFGAARDLKDAIKKRKEFLTHIKHPNTFKNNNQPPIPDHIKWVDLTNVAVVNKFDLSSRLMMFAKDYRDERPANVKQIFFSATELALIDKTIITENLVITQRLYSRYNTPVSFNSLPTNYKTVLLSLVYQGRYTDRLDKEIFELEAKGRWQQAADALSTKPGEDYKVRRKTEASFILKQLQLEQAMNNRYRV